MEFARSSVFRKGAFLNKSSEENEILWYLRIIFFQRTQKN
jgi:hypothetical protein